MAKEYLTNIQFKHTIIFGIMVGIVIGLSIGLFLGMYIASEQIVKTVSNLKIEKIEVGFNESYIMDRMENIITNLNKSEEGKARHSSQA